MPGEPASSPPVRSGAPNLRCYWRKGRGGSWTFHEGAAAGRPGDSAFRFKLKSGEEGPYPPGGITPGPVPVFAVGPGPTCCAEAGTADASTTIIAAVLRSLFISLVLCCSNGMPRGG